MSRVQNTACNSLFTCSPDSLYIGTHTNFTFAYLRFEASRPRYWRRPNLQLSPSCDLEMVVIPYQSAFSKHILYYTCIPYHIMRHPMVPELCRVCTVPCLYRAVSVPCRVCIVPCLYRAVAVPCCACTMPCLYRAVPVPCRSVCIVLCL